MSSTPCSFWGVPDQVLLGALRDLAARGCELEADLLAHLGEVDARGLHLGEGFPSMFQYCTEVLHFSESIAYHRICAARAACKFPLVLERLRSGDLHLSAVRLLAPHLTQENHAELLDLARHQSKRSIEQLLADHAPKPDAPSRVRRLPDARPPTAPNTREPARPQTPAAPARPQRPAPLGSERFKIQFTAHRETWEKLREAQALLRHRIPDGNLAEVFDRALGALLVQLRREKFSETDRPRACRPDERQRISRHIPAAIKREVASRDGSRCTFVSPGGHRCESRDFLEFHHLAPFARHHRHRAREITLRCRAHNHHAALADYGCKHMARFTRTQSTSPSPTVPGASSPSSTSDGVAEPP